MLLLLASIILGYLGLSIGGALHFDNFWLIAVSLIGFTAPYAYTIEKIYRKLYKEEEDEEGQGE